MAFDEPPPFGRDPGRRARVHERLERPGHEPIVDEELFLDIQALVAALEVPDAVVLHPVAEDQVLGARRRADRVGLHESQLPQGAAQRGGSEQALGGRKAAKGVGRDYHGSGRHYRETYEIARGSVKADPRPATGDTPGFFSQPRFLFIPRLPMYIFLTQEAAR